MAYWTLVISVFCYVGISALTGKAYYCRDPETGKLYAVNSTWQSSTFCGNYTCKLRKKDTDKTIVPIREMVIDSMSTTTKTKSIEEESMQTAASTNCASTSTKFNTIYPTLFTETPKLKSPPTTDASVPQNDKLNNIKANPSSDTHVDRYLTEDEIKTISNLLYSVKKSDLEAIVDIYNLAQDIYKEMDKITSQNIIDELRATKSSQKDERKKTYWYEPLNRLNKAADMEIHGTNAYPTALEKSTVNPLSYFQGPLSRTDFGTLPYYYSMSNFQRENSYSRDTKTHEQYPPRNDKPCTQNTPYQYHPGSEVSNPPAPIHYSYYPAQTYGSLINKPFPVKTQKGIQPSLILPYPFSFVQHNMSMYPYDLYYSGKPWSYYPENNNRNKDKTEQYFKAHEPEVIQNSLNSLTDVKSNKENAINPINEPIVDDKDETKRHNSEKQKDKVVHKNLLDTLLEQAKIEPKKPAWQTDPLASNVLEEIKAHFEEKAKLLKPLSFRKKTKLERVGKVLKLDELNRDKRSIDDESDVGVLAHEDFEAYVEKTTCQSETDPGFYKMGNSSQPYPACCPRKIENTQR